jgi:hypothetical protein
MNEPRTFIEFRPGMRRLIEDAIESLILLLDEIDGDADSEENPDREDDDPPEDDLCGLPDYGAPFEMDQRPIMWRCNESGASVPVKEP